MNFVWIQNVMKQQVMRKTDVDIAFLLDCTGSMHLHIQEVKEKIQTSMEEIQRRYNSRFSVGFVGYRDHEDRARIEALPFTTSVEEFKEFVSKVEATGGGDMCEDVFGGLEACINLQHKNGTDEKAWSKTNRCLIHIADAPCHGSRFHNLPRDNDLYYDHNELDVRGLTIERLVADLKHKNIKYYFAKIDSTTDKMNQEFQKVGGQDFVTTLDFSSLAHLSRVLVTSITNTISNTASVIIMREIILEKFCDMHLRRIDDRLEKTPRRFRVDKTEPDKDEQWEFMNAKIYTYEVINKTNELKFKTHTCKNRQLMKATQPFSKGSQRIAYYCIEKGRRKFPFFKAPTRKSNCVLKALQYTEEGSDQMSECEAIVKAQVVSCYYAEVFNKLQPKHSNPIRFIDARLVQYNKPDESTIFFTIEDIFPTTEEFTKYNNNAGRVNITSNPLLQTFSHWTYDYSGKYLMITDLQGVKDNDQYVLTDPSVHCEDVEFGSTNLKTYGMKLFFRSHICSKYCKDMNLSKNRYSLE